MDSMSRAAGAARKVGSLTVALTLALGATAGGASAAAATGAPAGCANVATVPTSPAMRQAAADAVLCLINAERAQRALAPVRSSSLLTKAAMSHAGDMVRRGYFSHETPSGQDLRARVVRTGYLRGARRPMLGETIAWGADAYAAPKQLVADLMRSAAHKAIVLDRRFRDIGVGLTLGAPVDGMGQGATLSLSFGRR